MKTSAFAGTTLYYAIWPGFASIQGTNSLQGKKGKGRVTPNPDTSGFGCTGGKL